MKDKIPVAPCKECLIKPLCKNRVRGGLISVSLRCSILDKWLEKANEVYFDGQSGLSTTKFEIVYNELSRKRYKK
jgi:hypothetical protein